MESINKITKYRICILLLTFIQGCWTSESDTTEVDKLLGNFKVIYNQNDTKAGHILSLNSKQGSYQHIEKRCEQIYFDSTEILVKYTWHDADTTHHYSRVKILTNEKISYQKHELSSKEFYKRVESCKDCVEKKYK
ncbi:hypothetical protein [Runella sp.]|uniref:hypothetical protein n=1 Tax=Runella sp. TaxID=1960881 RepID=UPI003D1328E8